MAALICNLSSPLGFTKVIVFDWWQCVWECVHMFGFTHAPKDWRHAASAPRFGDRMAARGWNRLFHHLACPDLYIWKRCFWHIYSSTIPFSTLWVLYSSVGGGGTCLLPTVHAVLEVLRLYGGASWAGIRSDQKKRNGCVCVYTRGARRSTPESGSQYVYETGWDRWGGPGHAEMLVFVFFFLLRCSHLLYPAEMIVGVVWRFTVKVQKEKICDHLQRRSQQTADELNQICCFPLVNWPVWPITCRNL